MTVRVRYAPSPTGFLHIGNARTALYNYLFAKSQGGDFILRIEDTDLERNIEGGEASQMNFLRWLGIEWDESFDVGGEYGPYRQLERLDIYRQYVDQLLEKGLAYKCYCTSEELEAEREAMSENGVDNIHYSRRCLNADSERSARSEYSVRFKVPAGEAYTFTDIVRSDVTFKSEDVGDWVIMKSNGIPTYNFACAIDDYLMKITHVFRGEEHITNTPKQMMVYRAFGWEVPTFAHMTLIVNETGKKLSKRDQDTIQFIGQYATMGYLPEALFNFIALLGWSPGIEEEILSHDQLVDLFDVNRLSKSPSTFDKNKLAYINQRYIKELTTEEVLELCMPHLVEAGILEGRSHDWGVELISLFHDRLTYGAEIVDLYEEFFSEEFSIDEEAAAFIAQEGVKQTLEAFKEELASLEVFTAEGIQASIKVAGKATKAKGKMLFMPCRIATTGQMHGPDLPKALALLGQETVIARIKKVIG